jgi:hypothetical protein
VCNGIDDDCDGTVDEGVKQTFYQDSDSDTYGNAGNSTEACGAPPNYVSNDDDCNDNNDEIHPGATEQCDDLDNDCDGAVDEGCVTYYLDGDGDGYGISNPTDPNDTMTVNSPAPPPGYVANDSDCDDENPFVYPGATEFIDGLDNDCDLEIDEGTCIADCSVCDLNEDGVCDETDLVIFGDSHGWGDWDCNEPNVDCICDIVVNAGGTCDDLDGLCFTHAFERPECRAPLYIEKLRRRSMEPGNRLRIIGKGFGSGDDSLVHIGPKEYEYGSSTRIKLWTDTKIKVKIPANKYTKNDCAWFKGQDYRKVRVWVTVGGVNSNKLKLKVLKPDTCP